MQGNEPKIPEMEPEKGGQYLGSRPFPADALIGSALGPIFLLLSKPGPKSNYALRLTKLTPSPQGNKSL